MARRAKRTLETVLGCPHPDEYDLRASFESLIPTYETGSLYISIDAGKVIGLARAYLALKEELENLKRAKTY